MAGWRVIDNELARTKQAMVTKSYPGMTRYRILSKSSTHGERSIHLHKPPSTFGWLSIKNITGPDPAKFTESTEGSRPVLRNLSENNDLSVPECSSGSGSNRSLWGLKIIIYWNRNMVKALIHFKLR